VERERPVYWHLATHAKSIINTDQSVSFRAVFSVFNNRGR